jgi:hypothetical protein
MPQISETPRVDAWYVSPALRIAGVGLILAIICAEGVLAIGFRDGDFEWHRWQGEAFLERKTDRNHYPPARGLMNVALTWGPYRVVRGFSYVLAVGALAACFWLWKQMAPAAGNVAVAAGIGAFFLLLPYLLRDLDECGLQILLLFMLTMGGFALSRGQNLHAGFWLATAAVYKTVPILALPFLLWKRQWKASAAMAGFLVLWCAAPALYSGWEHNVEAHVRFQEEAARIKSARQAYPSLLDREPPQIYNLSLNAAIARNLETYPPGHPLYLDHPMLWQWGNLTPEAAFYATNVILVVLGLSFLWVTRSAWIFDPATSIENNRFASEWAALAVLCALLSPLCWKQHLVLALPCAFLVMQKHLAIQPLSRWRVAIFGLIALIVYGCRDFIAGRELGGVLLSYKLDTMAVLALAGWALLWRGETAQAAARSQSTHPLAQAA